MNRITSFRTINIKTATTTITGTTISIAGTTINGMRQAGTAPGSTPGITHTMAIMEIHGQGHGIMIPFITILILFIMVTALAHMVIMAEVPGTMAGA